MHVFCAVYHKAGMYTGGLGMKTKPIVLWFVCLASMILWSPSWAAPVEPIADANGPYIGGIGELITFDGSGSYAIENPNPPPVNRLRAAADLESWGHREASARLEAVLGGYPERMEAEASRSIAAPQPQKNHY